MNRRVLPFSLIVAGSILAYACSSSSGGDPNPNPVPEGGSSGGDTFVPPTDSSLTDTNPGDTFVPPNGNPLDGIGAPTEITVFSGIYTEGPQWHNDGLYFSVVSDVNPRFVKFTPPSTTVELRAPAAGGGNIVLGNSYDTKTNTFISAEVTTSGAGGGAIVRTAGTVPAAGFVANSAVGTPITVTFDGGAPLFDSPNDLVARADGIIYATDPGYQTTTPPNNNHIWRLKPNGVGGVNADVFETNVEGRPNGIALSPDEKTLYVSFTDPSQVTAVTPANIMKYPVAVADGALGAGTKFADVGAAGSPPGGVGADGLAVDTSGNVYVAVKNGVDVFKPDGLSKWGHITTTKVINGIGFGGADKKTLYMTSDTGMLQVNVKIAGILQ